MKMRKIVMLLLIGSIVNLAQAQSVTAFTVSKNLFNTIKDTNVTLVFESSYNGTADLKLYNSAGEMVRNLDSQILNPTTANAAQTVIWDGKNKAGALVASGIYFFQLRLNFGAFSKRLMVITH
jgi:flagellar hook assembly protein FlgD